MIKQIVSEEGFARLEALEANDIYILRIQSLARAYADRFEFARFFLQTDASDRPTAIIGRLDAHLTLAALPEFDREELCAFLMAAGFETLLCDMELRLALPGARRCTGNVLRVKPGTCEPVDLPDALEIDTVPNLEEFSRFYWSEMGEAMFDTWYADVSHRIRHHSAEAFLLRKDGVGISAAMLSAVTKDGCIMSYVKTLPEYRRQGYAALLLNHVLALQSVPVYIQTERDMDMFYEQFGFERTGKWSTYYI